MLFLISDDEKSIYYNLKRKNKQSPWNSVEKRNENVLSKKNNKKRNCVLCRFSGNLCQNLLSANFPLDLAPTSRLGCGRKSWMTVVWSVWMLKSDIVPFLYNNNKPLVLAIFVLFSGAALFLFLLQVRTIDVLLIFSVHSLFGHHFPLSCNALETLVDSICLLK